MPNTLSTQRCTLQWWSEGNLEVQVRATLDDLELWNWSTALLCKVSHLVQFCMPTNINRYIDFQLFLLDLEIYIDLQLFILIFIKCITFQSHVLIFKKYVDFQMRTDVGRNILTFDSFCRYVVQPNRYSATTSDRKKGRKYSIRAQCFRSLDWISVGVLWFCICNLIPVNWLPIDKWRWKLCSILDKFLLHY